MLLKSLALKIQDNTTGTPTDLTPPTGIPSELGEGFSTSGNALIQTGLNMIFFVGAIIAVLVFMFSGIQWITSGGDPSKVASARKRLMFAVIGLVLMALSFVIVKVVFTTLGVDSSNITNPGSKLEQTR